MRFEYLDPASIPEAVALLLRYEDRARILAGGTDLMVQIQDGSLKPECLIDITYIAQLEGLTYDPRRGLNIGATTTISALEESREIREAYPLIWQAAGSLGSMAIRNVATLGGNLCNALPSADCAPALIALSATAMIVGQDGERTVPVEDFFRGVGRTVLRSGELLAGITVPVPAPNTRGMYLRYGRTASDLAVLGTAIALTMGRGGTCEDIRIVCGAVAPVPLRMKTAEAVLRGQRIDDAAIRRCALAAAAEANPRSGSIRASAEYKKILVAEFVQSAIKQLLEQSN